MEELKENFEFILLNNYINEENIECLIKFLNSSFAFQKIFIELIEKIINYSSLENTERTFPIFEKINKHLSNIIPRLGISFG